MKMTTVRLECGHTVKICSDETYTLKNARFLWCKTCKEDRLIDFDGSGFYRSR